MAAGNEVRECLGSSKRYSKQKMFQLIAAAGLWAIRPGFILALAGGIKIMRGNTISFCAEFVIGRSTARGR